MYYAHVSLRGRKIKFGGFNIGIVCMEFIYIVGSPLRSLWVRSMCVFCIPDRRAYFPNPHFISSFDIVSNTFSSFIIHVYFNSLVRSYCGSKVFGVNAIGEVFLIISARSSVSIIGEVPHIWPPHPPAATRVNYQMEINLRRSA